LPTALKRKSKIAALFLLLGLSAQVFGAEVGPEWALVDSVSFQGKIPAGDRLVISFDSITSLLQLLALEDSLTDLAEQAVEKAPDWLKADLADIFSRMDVSYQDVYAQLILDAEDPVVDEVVFQVAHIAPEVLANLAADDFSGLLVENAEGLYQNDAYLDYVQVVNYGASSDEDYYSTTRYRMETAEGDTVEYEFPKRYYYWYVVHPMAIHSFRGDYDAYVDPNTGEMSSPPKGVFWRDYLFNHADPGYPILRDRLSHCQTLWNSLVNVDSTANGAVGIVSQWVQDVVEWGIERGRSRQPVRIYDLHNGHCGEWANITVAAARSALIPTTTVGTITNDHVWNEFWADRWVQWEPFNTYVDSSSSYEGWGWELSTVAQDRGDGYVELATDRYTATAPFTVEILDGRGYPVDGALVSLYAPYMNDPSLIWPCTWMLTDFSRQCTFAVGDHLDYYVTVESEIGSYREGDKVKVITDSQAGEEYLWSCNLESEVFHLEANPATKPSDQHASWMLNVVFETPYGMLYGRGKYDFDPYGILPNAGTCAEKAYPGAVDFFLCDSANYQKYQAREAFEAYQIQRDVALGDAVFTVSTDGVWYAVLSNEEALVAKQQVEVKLELYEKKPAAVAEADDAFDVPKVFSLSQNYPNPFNPSTTIRFALAEEGLVDLSVYNVLGQRIRTLISEKKTVGSYSVVWDGRDEKGIKVASGVYLYRLETERFVAAKKMVVLD
jgi:hypothetical protein